MGNDLNSVTLIGRLVKDPELKQTQNGTVICNFSIAVGEKFSGQEHVNYFDIVTFGNNAQNIAKYCTKGTQVCVNGSLKQERWQDQQTGINRSKVVIKAFNVQFLQRSQSQQQHAQSQQMQQNVMQDPWAGQQQMQPQQYNQGGQAAQVANVFDGQKTNNDNDIPF